MKPDAREKGTRLVLSLICFTAYIALFVAVIANAFKTSLHSFLQT